MHVAQLEKDEHSWAAAPATKLAIMSEFFIVAERRGGWGKGGA
jgi:hypothetical protein